MNKQSMVKQVAEQAKLTQTDTSKAIDALFSTIQKSLKKGEPVTIVGFGTFKVTKRKARSGRNPRTGESISIPASTVPAFSAGKALKEAINKKK